MCGETEENLIAMVGNFAEVCRKRDLKVIEGKNKIIVLGEEEEFEWRFALTGYD